MLAKQKKLLEKTNQRLEKVEEAIQEPTDGRESG